MGKTDIIINFIGIIIICLSIILLFPEKKKEINRDEYLKDFIPIDPPVESYIDVLKHKEFVSFFPSSGYKLIKADLKHQIYLKEKELSELSSFNNNHREVIRRRLENEISRLKFKLGEIEYEEHKKRQ